jgi:hypothetical protein
MIFIMYKDLTITIECFSSTCATAMENILAKYDYSFNKILYVLQQCRK